MSQELLLGSLTNCLNHLVQQQVIAYPTEAVFGLGCDPDSEQAVNQLLQLKQRDWQKGLILIAADYQQLLPYVDDQQLTLEQKQRMFAHWPGAVTFVVPAALTTPKWLTGRFDSIAIRVSDHPLVQNLCRDFGKPLVSTSANLAGHPPCRNWQQVLQEFGETFPVVKGETGGRTNPSEIRHVVSGDLIRRG